MDPLHPHQKRRDYLNFLIEFSESAGIRTLNILLKRQTLYR